MGGRRRTSPTTPSARSTASIRAVKCQVGDPAGELQAQAVRCMCRMEISVTLGRLKSAPLFAKRGETDVVFERHHVADQQSKRLVMVRIVPFEHVLADAELRAMLDPQLGGRMVDDTPQDEGADDSACGIRRVHDDQRASGHARLTLAQLDGLHSGEDEIRVTRPDAQKQRLGEGCRRAHGGPTGVIWVPVALEYNSKNSVLVI